MKDSQPYTDKLPPARGPNGRLLPGRAPLNPRGRPKKSESNRLEDKVDVDLAEASRLPEDMIPEDPKPIKDPERDKWGRFTTGNTASKRNGGRKKVIEGGKINSDREARDYIKGRLHEVLARLVDDAAKGCTASSKILIDRVMPQLKAIEHVGVDVSKLPRMVIELPPDSEPRADSTVIDVEPEAEQAE